MEMLSQFAKNISSLGITNIDYLVYDDSYFPSFPPAWEWEDVQDYYGAQPNSLVVTQNAVTVTVTPGGSPGS